MYIGLALIAFFGLTTVAVSPLNGVAWQPQMVDANKGGPQDLCGDVSNPHGESDAKDAALAGDCMSLLNQVYQDTRLTFFADRSNWTPDTVMTGLMPVMTNGTCTLGIRPTVYDETRFVYYVGYQDVADLLHTFINELQVKIGDDWRFGMSGTMNCNDNIKHQGSYDIFFRFYNPQAQ